MTTNHTNEPTLRRSDGSPVRPVGYTGNPDWTARVSEANDGIGAARDAMRHARTTQERLLAEADLNWWQSRLANVKRMAS